MQVEFNIYSVPLLFGFWHGLLFTTLLYIRGFRQERLSDYLLATLLLLASIYIMPYMLGFMNVSVMWDELLFFPTDPGLLIGPVIYFYLITQTNQDFQFSRKDFWHLLLFAIYFFYHLVIFVQGKDMVQWWIHNVDSLYVEPAIKVITLAANYYYLYISMRYYRRYRSWVESTYADPEPIQFRWYRNFLYLMGASITLSWSFAALNELGAQLSYTQNWWEYFFIAILVYLLSLFGFTQNQRTLLFFDKNIQSEAQEKNNIQDKITNQELATWRDKIQQFLTDDKIYLQPELSLIDMADRLEISSNMLSQYINLGFGINFKQLINDFRIGEFKKEVVKESNSHMTLLAIAMNCGFNSKATFNRVFKKSTGLSPREYIDQAKSDSTS
ncbi:MAG: AraC family transcriptional regulator [Saprospiraceae bacterium]|nr:AraC family transcriptional regulator [Saprospiraceae bacterium]